MADPWAAFRLPQSNAARIVANDPPATAIPRPPVAPSARVWGDAEAEGAGLYETQGDPWAAFRVKESAATSTAPPPQAQPTASFAERFPDQPYQNDALRADVARTARGMTTGKPTGFGQRIAIDYLNSQTAAAQGTTPSVDVHYPNLVSDELLEDEMGGLHYKDASGREYPTDASKHVVLRDPSDGRLKVFARTADTDEGRLSAGGRLLMGGMASGAVTARPSIATAAAKSVVPTASDIMSTSKPLYRAFEKEGSDVFVATKNTVERLKSAMEKARQPEHLAGEVYKTVDTLATAGDDMISLTRLRDLKELIGQSARSPDARVRSAAGAANAELRKIIGEAAPDAAKNLQTADEIYGTAKSVQDLQRKSSVADLRAGRAGYGGNSVNSMRQVLSPIVQRAIEGKVTGFKPDEIAAMREIVEGTPATNTLRMVGQASPSRGMLATTGGAITGGAAGVAAAGPVGLAGAVALPALGAVSNKLATVLTGRQIDRLKELVAKRSPAYAQAVEKALARYSNAQEELSGNPSPAKFAAYLSASRALASGLQRDGIQVTSGELLRSITGGPMKAAADGDEQPVPGSNN